MNNMYFIAGCPRSGTSMIAGLMQRCGVWTGVCIGADEHNKEGYYENVEIVELIKHIMRSNGMKARSDALPVNDLKISFDLRKAVLKIVGKESVWLYKDSKLLLLYPLFVKAFPEATWILPMRNTEGIIESLSNHKVWKNRVKEVNSVRHFSTMITRLKIRQQELLQLHNVNTHIVNTNEIINSKVFAEIFINSIGLEFNTHAYDDFIKPELWHEKT